MVISIDIEFLSKNGLSPNEYCFLYLMYHDSKSSMDVDNSIISSLETKGFIKDQDDGVVLRKKTIDLFLTAAVPTKVSDLAEFIEEYRNVFPAGVKSGGRLVKGDKHGCLTKMKTFRARYPEYSREDVLDAAKAYVDAKRKTNYSMMVCADYFIEKDKMSMLSSYCEDIKLRGKQVAKNESIGKTKAI